MTHDKLRVGIIGAGMIAAIAHIPQLRKTGRAEVVALARRKPDRLALMQKELNIAEGYTDWREMLDKSKLDAVVIATPHNLHVEPALAALDCGLHVLLEKPAADTIEGARTLVKAARKSDRVFTVAENVRGEGRWRTIKRALDTGKIGKLRQVDLVYCYDARTGFTLDDASGELLLWMNSTPMMKALGRDFFAPDAWRKDAVQMGGDSFIDMGVHLVDMMLMLGGASALYVSAFRAEKIDEPSAILTVSAQLANGVLLSISYNDKVQVDSAALGERAQLTAAGSDGCIIVEWGGAFMQSSTTTHLLSRGAKESIALDDDTVAPAVGFVASILDGAPNFCTIEDGLHAVALVRSAYRAAETRQVVTVPALP